MGLFDYITTFNYINLRQKFFRREIEASAFAGKKFTLPKLTIDLSPVIFKNNYPFRFFSSVDEKAQIKLLIEKSESKAEIINQADKIMNNIYDICCSGVMSLGEEIVWHKDYKSGFEWQNVLTWRADFFNMPKGTDIKYPWEIARFHQLQVLGKAYLLSSDEKYALKYKSLIESFILSNRFCFGVNWLNSAEVSIRVINLVYSFGFFVSSDNIDANFISTFNDLILHHTIFIDNNLNYSQSRDSAYLLNLLALGACGLLYKNDYYGKKLLRFAQSGFETEIRSQLYEDGVSREQSVPLYSLIVEAFYLGRLVLNKAGMTLTGNYDVILKKLFEVQYDYLRDDFSVPQIGDSITSRILPLNTASNNFDYSYPMPVAGYLYKDAKYKQSIFPGAELILLFGAEAFKEYEDLSTTSIKNKSAGYLNGGHYIFRNENLHLFVEAGEIGNNGRGAPGHNDTFTFELYYKKKLFIVDPGTYSIYADNELRNRLRSVKYHNTAYIDDMFLSEVDGIFRIKEDLTKPKLLEWNVNDDEEILSAQHYAYTRLPDPVICKRTFRFSKTDNSIKITDEFIGGMEHKIVLNFHLHPDVQITNTEEGKYLLENSGEKISIKVSSEAVNKTIGINDSVYSSKYGCINKSKKVTVIIKQKFPAVVETEIQLL